MKNANKQPVTGADKNQSSRNGAMKPKETVREKHQGNARYQDEDQRGLGRAGTAGRQQRNSSIEDVDADDEEV